MRFSISVIKMIFPKIQFQVRASDGSATRNPVFRFWKCGREMDLTLAVQTFSSYIWFWNIWHFWWFFKVVNAKGAVKLWKSIKYAKKLGKMKKNLDFNLPFKNHFLRLGNYWYYLKIRFRVPDRPSLVVMADRIKGGRKH